MAQAKVTEAANAGQSVTSLTRITSVANSANQQLAAKGVHIVGYDLSGLLEDLVRILEPIDVLISCITWEQLDQQIPWIEAAKIAGVKRFVPSEWVGPAPRGVIDIKDKVHPQSPTTLRISD